VSPSDRCWLARCTVLLLSACLCRLIEPQNAVGQTPSFSSAITNGFVTTTEIWEASGLAASRQNPGVLWTHNDSGFPGTVFALSTNGTLLGQCEVPNVFSGDFEDIAIGPGPSPGLQYIYLGDIGDNSIVREQIRVFRIPEPSIYFYQSNSPPIIPAVAFREIVFTYPDGPHNAEALMVDPWTGDIFIATKATNSSGIYQATRAELESGAPVELTHVEELDVRSTSAGDISADGRLIALRRGSRAELWTRSPGQSVADALEQSSARIPVVGAPTEPNGEALTFDWAGAGYYTLSEGYGQPIYFFRRTDSGKPVPPRIFIAPGTSWHYLDDGSDQDVAWRASDFDDSFWPEGSSQFGYGQNDEQTVLFYGDDSFKVPTTYFRKQFEVSSIVAVSNLALRVCFNDGIAIYFNGVEIWRHNLAPDAGFDAVANGDRSTWQNIWWSIPIQPSVLHDGVNAIAVELHRFDLGGPDLSFDLQLLEATVELARRFTAAPQLTNDVCHVELAGPVGSIARIEASLDLVEWLPAASVVLDATGTGSFEEPATEGPRFYRIAVDPQAPH